MKREWYWHIILAIVFYSIAGMFYSCKRISALNEYPEKERLIINDTLSLNQPLEKSLILKINVINRLFDSLDIVVAAGDIIEEARILARLANHFRLSGNYNESVRFYRNAMKAAGNILPIDNSIIHHGLASVYYEMYFHDKMQAHYIDSAEVHAVIAYDFANQAQKPILIADALNVQGAVEIQRKNYASAIDLLEKALLLLEKEHSGNKLPVMSNISYVYIMKGEFQKALDFAEEGYLKALNSGNIVFAGINLENLVRIYINLNDTQSAEHYQKILSSLKDDKGMLVQSLILKQQLLNHKIQQDQHELSGLYRERFILLRAGWILAGGFILLLVISMVLFYLLRQHKRIRQREAQLKQEREHAVQLKLKNTALELKAREAEAKALQVELESRNTTLASKILNLSKVNEFLNILGKEISKLSKGCDEEQQETREQLAKIQNKISNNINLRVWEEFEMFYASGNGGFSTKIAEEHPNLTIHDKRLCYLILTDLTTKEISNIMCKSYRSVEMARHRLRNKLELDRESNLRDYLLKYTDSGLES
ncbi:MAG: DUF4381 domain-containing protein [Bacteroidales bacterium]|nr:DUF4381 domain-containing protein [Bacteroidales bacterium]